MQCVLDEGQMLEEKIAQFKRADKKQYIYMSAKDAA